MMADAQTPQAVELLKYPLAVLSVFLALVGAKYVLGVPFGAVSEITSDGVKFAQDAKGEIAALSAQLNAAVREIEEIRKQLPEKPLPAAARSEIFEASQTVSTQTAQLASVDTGSALPGLPSKGYIWIGDYDAKRPGWIRVKLVSPATNETLSSPPPSVSPGAVFTVSSNMVLRDGLPPNNADYFQSRRSLGVLPTGTKVVIQSAPVAIDREFAVQYWAEVAVQR
jgi:hypothetical protein